MDAAAALEGEGLSVGVASAHTVKPLDEEGIARILAKHRRVVVIEEMVPHGGLGEAVKAIAWERGAKCDLRCLSLRHEFVHVYGSHEQLLAAHGLTPRAITQALQGG